MALKKCKECGNDVSTQAKACPSCGAVVKSGVNCGGCAAIFAVFFVIAVAIGVITDTGDNSSGSPTPSQPTYLLKFDQSPEMQKGRKELVEKVIREGVFAKVEQRGSTVEVWVNPIFYTLDFKDKQNFAACVYALYFDGTSYGDIVKVINNKTGNEIGIYSAGNNGLKLE